MCYNLLINGVYWGYNPLILTIDPNFLSGTSKHHGRLVRDRSHFRGCAAAVRRKTCIQDFAQANEGKKTMGVAPSQ